MTYHIQKADLFYPQKNHVVENFSNISEFTFYYTITGYYSAGALLLPTTMLVPYNLNFNDGAYYWRGTVEFTSPNIVKIITKSTNADIVNNHFVIGVFNGR